METIMSLFSSGDNMTEHSTSDKSYNKNIIS
jgi:hypothetical protein